MQSGTILHLALLRKLSSQSPKANYHHRFNTFRAAIANAPPVPTRVNHNSAELYRKYPSKEPVLNFMSRSSRSSRQKIQSSRVGGVELESLNQKICGWSIENQSMFEWVLKWKKNQLKTGESKLTSKERSNKKYTRKSSFCQEIRPNNYALKTSSKQNFPAVKNKILIITPSLTDIPVPPLKQTNSQSFHHKNKTHFKENISPIELKQVHQTFRTHPPTKKEQEFARSKIATPKVSVNNIQFDV